MDAIDRALLHEDRLTPSPGFSTLVMARVRLDPFHSRPTRLHWGWIALLVLVAAVCSPWLFLAEQVDRDLALMIAWGAALFATSVSLAGLSYQLLDL